MAVVGFLIYQNQRINQLEELVKKMNSERALEHVAREQDMKKVKKRIDNLSESVESFTSESFQMMNGQTKKSGGNAMSGLMSRFKQPSTTD